MSMKSMRILSVSLLMATALSGCGTWDRLKNVGKHPELTPIENPVDALTINLYLCQCLQK